ncbi:MAG: hypothetical protein SGI99_13360 [Pseudomonadota bacterium]|nr:hypothetical protein [Pseudomonadota bacterium]
MNHSLVCCAPARPILLLLGLLGLMLSCSVLAQPLTYLVGAGSVPNQCDHNSLQQAINAAASHPGEDFIRVANDQSYVAQALSIGQQDLTITGGYANCGAALPPEALPTGNTIVDGAGGAAAPVISITGSGVRVLTSLQIRNGDNVQFNGSGCGGGIQFNGRGELLLRNVGISQNDANSGGGICFTGTDSPSALSVEGDVAINNNEATTGNGGGIAITGASRLFVLRDRTSIAFNRALSGHGGGIYMQAPARADIGSPGYNGLGVLYANEANRGGGVAGYAPEDSGSGHACLRFFSTDASRPVRIQNNRATNAGGGLYLRSDAGGLDSFYTIEGRAYDFRIDGNTAPNGPAIFLNGDDTVFFNFDYGSSMVLNDRSNAYDDCNEPLNALGRVACTNKSECNRIENNRAVDINGQPTNGNVIELQDDSSLYGQTLTMQGNTGARLLSWSAGDYGYIKLKHCALISNTLTQEVFRGFNEGRIESRTAPSRETPLAVPIYCATMAAIRSTHSSAY